jgi:FkbM family methyltransferase
MSLRQDLKNHYRLFGLRGFVMLAMCRAFGRPKNILVKVPGIKHRIALRIRTSDVLAFEQVLLRHEYDFDLPISPRTIIDAGANIGLTSIFFACKYPNAKIIAVEPEASNFSALVRNVSSYPNVVPVYAALWSKECEMGILSWGEHDHWGYRVQEGLKGCRGITMHTLMEETGISSVDLFKADIEGAEKELFTNARWVNGIPLVIVELHDHMNPGCKEAVEMPLRDYRRSIRGELTLYSAPLAGH